MSTNTRTLTKYRDFLWLWRQYRMDLLRSCNVLHFFYVLIHNMESLVTNLDCFSGWDLRRRLAKREPYSNWGKRDKNYLSTIDEPDSLLSLNQGICYYQNLSSRDMLKICLLGTALPLVGKFHTQIRRSARQEDSLINTWVFCQNFYIPLLPDGMMRSQEPTRNAAS